MNNRKLVWTIGILLGIGLTGYSQQVRYGLQVGFDIANAQLTNRTLIDNHRIYYPLYAFNLNGYAEIKYTNRLGLALEPGFIQKGSTARGTDVDNHIRLNCIQLPILGEWYLTDQWFISAGPEISYMINATGYSDGSKNDMSALFDHQMELSGLVGINYRVTSHVDFALRYNHGITSVSNIDMLNDTGVSVGSLKEYNQYFQLMARYRL